MRAAGPAEAAGVRQEPGGEAVGVRWGLEAAAVATGAAAAVAAEAAEAAEEAEEAEEAAGEAKF